MLTLEEIQSDISEYLLTLKARNGIDIAPKTTRDKWQRVFDRIVLVSLQHGHETPDEKDYEEYRANNAMSNETFETYKKGIDKFFSWRQKRRQEQMLDETITSEVSAENAPVIEAETVAVENEIVNNTEPSQVAEHVEGVPVERKNNAGRKKFDTAKGETRTEKLMLYLTKSVIADVRDWCSLKDLSANDYITGLIVSDLASKQDKLNSFRQLRDEA